MNNKHRKGRRHSAHNFGLKLSSALVVAMMTISSAAEAGVLCIGPVNTIRIRDTNLLTVNWGWNHVGLCSFDTNYTYGTNIVRTYTPADCTRLYAMAMTAMGSGKDFGGYFSGTYPGGCSDVLPSVNAAPPNEAILWFYIDEP